jgi:hypothetical protein
VRVLAFPVGFFLVLVVLVLMLVFLLVLFLLFALKQMTNFP